jgi:hypothetical protein
VDVSPLPNRRRVASPARKAYDFARLVAIGRERKRTTSRRKRRGECRIARQTGRGLLTDLRDPLSLPANFCSDRFYVMIKLSSGWVTANKYEITPHLKPSALDLISVLRQVPRKLSRHHLLPARKTQSHRVATAQIEKPVTTILALEPQDRALRKFSRA